MIDPEFPAPQQKLFPSLLPKQVREALTAFAKEAGEVVAAAESEGREASKDARQQLSSIGLPGSLEVRCVCGRVLDGMDGRHPRSLCRGPRIATPTNEAYLIK